VARAWVGRLLLGALAGLAVGLVIFVAARGVTGALMLAEQRRLLGDVASALGALDGPPAADLRAARLQLAALDAQYARLSALAGLLAGVPAALSVYLRLEREALNAERRT
jgi:hypothetical protein